YCTGIEHQGKTGHGPRPTTATVGRNPWLDKPPVHAASGPTAAARTLLSTLPARDTISSSRFYPSSDRSFTLFRSLTATGLVLLLSLASDADVKAPPQRPSLPVMSSPAWIWLDDKAKDNQT